MPETKAAVSTETSTGTVDSNSIYHIMRLQENQLKMRKEVTP